MLENLSFVLMGLAALVAVVTFLGAHSSPVNIPNMSKGGCTVTAGLMILGAGAGLYEPVAKFNKCMTVCEDAMLSESEAFAAWKKAGDSTAALPAVDHGDYTFVAPGRVDFLSCHKGAVDKYSEDMRTYVKYQDKVKAGEATGPELEAPQREDFSVTDERCQAQGRGRCTTVCNDPELAAEAAAAPDAETAEE